MRKLHLYQEKEQESPDFAKVPINEKFGDS